ncbi:DUF3137 domain-containing protein [Salinarimonas sp.]|uniref:DUF3137 domain-containing protein n=1 Tax=Salinarimonas sp. TaxID=2766526 RepID=UPI0032D9898D
MTPTFTEQHPWEEGFAEVFAREIVPRLGPLEKKRRAILAKRKNRLRVVGGVTVVALAAAWLFAPGWEIAAVISAFVAFGALAATILVFSFGQDAFSERVTAEIMPRVADFLGMRFDPKAAERPDIGAFRDAGLVSQYERAGFSDGLAGHYRGVDFTACEASLSKTERDTDSKGRSRTKRVTVFSGVIATFSVPRPAPGVIVIRRDVGRVLNAVFGFFDSRFKGLEKVEIPHAGFEEAFEVRAENPQAARDFVTGPFLDALLALSQGEGEAQPRPVGGAFVGDRFHLTVSGLSLASVGPVSESLDAIEPRLHATLADMRFPLRVIDRFYGE